MPDTVSSTTPTGRGLLRLLADSETLVDQQRELESFDALWSQTHAPTLSLQRQYLQRVALRWHREAVRYQTRIPINLRIMSSIPTDYVPNALSGLVDRAVSGNQLAIVGIAAVRPLILPDHRLGEVFDQQSAIHAALVWQFRHLCGFATVPVH